jgi:hypothetical protein
MIMKTNIPIQIAQSPKSKVQSPAGAAQDQAPDIQRRINGGWLKLWRKVYPNTPLPRGKVDGSRLKVAGSGERRPAAVERLASLLAVWFALVLLATGCAGRPLKGGRAVTTRKPAGVIEQTLVQSESPNQASQQTQESVKVRTYTLPAGSRVVQSQMPRAAAPEPASAAHDPQPSTLRSAAMEDGSTLNPQPSSTAFLLSAPMPVVEREETHARTELGAAQKDTARELGAKLSSLKGVVWIGTFLLLAGIASLVWPPAKAIVGSVTTSAALMLGGLALMVLPTLVVGNELLILGGVVLAVGGWSLAHRHGQLRGIVGQSPKSKV